MKVTHKHMLLQWPHIKIQNVHPFCVKVDLVHVDVSGGHSLISRLQPLIIVTPITPLSIIFSHSNKLFTKLLSEHWEPVNIRTRLLQFGFSIQTSGIIWMEISQFPVISVSFHLPKCIV